MDGYFKRIASNDIATEVKFADMRHNCDKARWPSDMQAEAHKNYLKYGGRIEKLFYMTGEERIKKLLTGEARDWLEDFMLGFALGRQRL